MKKIVYIDMDHVLADFEGGKAKVPKEIADALPWNERWQEPAFNTVEGFFFNLDPMPGAIEAVKALEESGLYDLHVLTASPWENPGAAAEKMRWIKKWFGEGTDNVFFRKITISHNKEKLKGDYIIDDRMDMNGAGQFEGEKIHFGSERFPDWESVTRYLICTLRD